MAKKELKPSQIKAQQEAENAAALEALRKRREKEHRKMERSKGSNKQVGKSWKNDIGIFLFLTLLGLFMLLAASLCDRPDVRQLQGPVRCRKQFMGSFLKKRFQQYFCNCCGDRSARCVCLYGGLCACKVQIPRR